MALVKAALKQEMLNATENGDKRASVLDNLAKAIQDYVKDNAEFQFSWTGVLPSPPGTTDPVTIAKGEFINLTVMFSSFKAANPDQGQTAFDMFGTDLITSFTTAMYNVSDPGFSTAPMLFGSAPALATLKLSPSQKDKREDAFDVLADQIVTWVTSQVPAAPCAGTHGSFVGTASCIKVS